MYLGIRYGYSHWLFQLGSKAILLPFCPLGYLELHSLIHCVGHDIGSLYPSIPYKYHVPPSLRISIPVMSSLSILRERLSILVMRGERSENPEFPFHKLLSGGSETFFAFVTTAICLGVLSITLITLRISPALGRVLLLRSAPAPLAPKTGYRVLVLGNLRISLL